MPLSFPIRTWIRALFVASLLVGSLRTGTQLASTPEDGDRLRGVIDRHHCIRQRTSEMFANAAYFSPVHETKGDARVWMAPLLLQEVRLAQTDRPEYDRFGTITVNASHRHEIDASQPTVYTTARRIRISGRLYRQDTYVWFYEAKASGQALRYRGVRQTLGRNGFPLIRETISSESNMRVFFIAKSLEREATQRHGAPLPGRQFAAEPSLVKHQDVLVARVLADGAQPMGPFVYTDSDSLLITNLKCRCEPSQVSEFSISGHYHLRRVTGFESLFAEQASKDSEFPLPANAAQLDGILRLPDPL